MRTLTEKYNAVLEGTFPKKQFVRDAKLSHPNFITQFTSYEDAVKILKNKGLVHENKKILKEFMLSDPEVAQLARGEKIRVSADRNALGVDGREIMLINPETDKYETHTISVRQLGNAVEISTTPAQGRKEQVTQESTRTYTGKQVSAMAKRAGDRVLDARDSLLELVIGYGDRIPKEEVLQVLSHYDLELKDVTGRGASNADTDYQIPSWLLETGTKKQKVSDTFPKTNLPLTALDKAIKYELEKAGVDYLMAAPDTDDYLKAKAKAEKALAKDRLYYLELNTSKKKRTDLMEPATAKNVVDKGNEMKKVKAVKENTSNRKQASNEILKEAIKQIIKNSLKEESEPFRVMSSKLLRTLSEAIEAAERVGTAAEMDRDNVADDPQISEITNRVEDALRQIYNAYLTGNRMEDRSGEIFKNIFQEERGSSENYDRMKGLSNTKAQEAVKKSSAILLRELTDEGFEEAEVLEFIVELAKTNYGIFN